MYVFRGSPSGGCGRGCGNAVYGFECNACKWISILAAMVIWGRYACTFCMYVCN